MLVTRAPVGSMSSDPPQPASESLKLSSSSLLYSQAPALLLPTPIADYLLALLLEAKIRKLSSLIPFLV